MTPDLLTLASRCEEADGRQGDWMQTFNGRQFWPLDPRPEEICIEDIAHALSMQCRYAGHCLRFYSVAEHSVLLSRAVSHDNRLWALLHDASEAYLVDLPRPVKHSVVGYAAAEDAVMAAVCRKFELPTEIPAEVKAADRAILTDEMRQNMAKPPVRWSTEGEPLGVKLGFWSPNRAHSEFMAAFHEYAPGRSITFGRALASQEKTDAVP